MTNLLKRTKDTVDFVYGILSAEPGGVELHPSSLGYYESIIVRLLLKKKILKKELLRDAGRGRRYKYIWNPVAMAPTENLYQTIKNELESFNREHHKKYRGKKPCVGSQNYDAEPLKKIQPSSLFSAPSPSLDKFTSQELWDELKKRGYGIEGERLVIVKREYLN